MAAVLVVLLAYLLAPTPVSVELARAARGPMTVTVSSEGQTRVKDEYEVSAPIGGRLLRIALKAGDAVTKADTVIAVIQPPPPQFNDVRSMAELQAKVRAAQAAQAAATADLERAKAQLEFAKSELSRDQSLVGVNAVTQTNLQQSQRNVKTSEAAVVAAEDVLKQRTAELDATLASLSGPDVGGEEGRPQDPVVVRAPVTGRVLRVLKESATIVAPGMPLVEIGNVGNLEVMLEMLSEDAIKVREGATATLDGWGGETLHARVRLVEPFGFTKISALGVEEQRVRVFLDFTDPPQAWERLGQGYRVTAHIVVWHDDHVLRIPIGVLIRDGNRWAAYVAQGGVAHLQPLEIGHTNDTEAEVLKGLSEGQQVILHPSDQVTEGVHIVDHR